jgi:predicted Zn finger-like uncharacterized protein
MNNACPTCGAVYAVTTKDIGRKLKCKKCSTALTVTDAGLVVDTPTGSAVAAAIPAAVADDFDTGGDVVVSPKGKKAKKFGGGPGMGELVAKVGGIPTILFGFGTFLVIWFTFMTPIGAAAVDRADAAVDKLQNEMESEIKGLVPKGKTASDVEGYPDKEKKIREDYAKRIESAQQDAKSTRINNIRSVWFDKYGLMFGFIFVAFGCIGYLRTEQPLIMRIVAATVLGLLLLMILSHATGCTGGGGSIPRPPISTKGGFPGG